jgi:hypothetical protein
MQQYLSKAKLLLLEFSSPESLYREPVSEISGEVHVTWLLPCFCFAQAVLEAFE